MASVWLTWRFEICACSVGYLIQSNWPSVPTANDYSWPAKIRAWVLCWMRHRQVIATVPVGGEPEE
jgi:hypothetical protein